LLACENAGIVDVVASRKDAELDPNGIIEEYYFVPQV
jgi:hypothetical protein